MTITPCIPCFRAVSVTVAAGVTTITLPANTEITDGELIDILLTTPIPDGTGETQIVISNGTVTGNLLNGNGNYLRMPSLKSRIIIRCQFLDDPAHFQIIDVFGRRFRKVCGCTGR